jgi:hypothetical protein
MQDRRQKFTYDPEVFVCNKSTYCLDVMKARHVRNGIKAYSEVAQHADDIVNAATHHLDCRGRILEETVWRSSSTIFAGSLSRFSISA